MESAESRRLAGSLNLVVWFGALTSAVAVAFAVGTERGVGGAILSAFTVLVLLLIAGGAVGNAIVCGRYPGTR